MTHVPESTKANTALKSQILKKIQILLYTLFHCGRGSNMYLIFFKPNLIFCISLL